MFGTNRPSLKNRAIYAKQLSLSMERTLKRRSIGAAVRIARWRTYCYVPQPDVLNDDGGSSAANRLRVRGAKE